MTQKQKFPIIDISKLYEDNKITRQEIGKEIDFACRHQGFFYITGHHISPTLLKTCFELSKVFFELPIEEKQKISIEQSPCHRGWFQRGYEKLNPKMHPKGDIKEGIKIGNPLTNTHPLVREKISLHGENQYPDIIGWREKMHKIYQHFCLLGYDLMRGISLGLHLPEDYFQLKFTKNTTELMATLSPLHYPPLSSYADHISASPHTDFGCLTIITQEATSGLEIQNRQGQWQEIPPQPKGYKDSLLIIVGDMLRIWTDESYISPIHKVHNRTQETRQSLAFFFDPPYDTLIAVLPELSIKENHIKPRTALDYIQDRIDESFTYR